MTDHYQEYWTRADFIDAPTAEADELRAENERLRAALYLADDGLNFTHLYPDLAVGGEDVAEAMCREVLARP